MLWGKKILQWSATPQEALATMIDLNNRYALDGRDPNSYSGIFWILGRYDRPWGPERPIFGTVRYMSSENTARKVRVKDYLARYADQRRFGSWPTSPVAGSGTVGMAFAAATAARIAAMARTAFVAALLALGLAARADAQVTAFVDGRVIDGTGKVIERGTVVVRDGRIAEVGPTASVRVPDGATRVPLTGKTLMPGIVNAHGHLSAVDGLSTGAEFYTRANLERQLRAYATYGVTTVFSLGDDQADAFALRAEQADGAAAARARLRGRPDRLHRHGGRGPRRDRQGHRARAGSHQGSRRRQPRHRQEDARGGVARHARAGQGREAHAGRAHLSTSPTRRRWPRPATSSSPTACATCRWTTRSSRR